MKIEGVFLDSRLGRRIFLLFVLAATVPVALLGGLAYGGWNAYAAAQEQARLDQSTRYLALAVFDRLVAAKSVLRSTDVRPGDDDGHGIFRSVDWVPSGDGEGGERLSWLPAPHAREPARISVRVRDPVSGRMRSGELDPRYLWSAAFEDVSGEQVCVFDSGGEQIFCSAEEDHGAALAPSADAASASWALFLRHEFGVDDWRFTVRRQPSASAGFSLVHIGWQVVLASLLLVITLSLVLVRRTTVPLQRLTAGTRRLAVGDYGARVDVRGGDEFGELGTAFNDMAARIGQQVHQLEVLSAIDRDILEANDPGRLVVRALARLAELSPGVRVGIGVVDARDPARVGVTWRGTGGETERLELGMPPPVQAALLRQPDGRWWRAADGALVAAQLAALGGVAGAVYVVPVRWQAQLLAVLLIDAAEDAAAVEAPVGDPLGELRDRLAVALASAARERQLQHRATHDSLTGMRNRAGLMEVLAVAMQAGQRFALLWIDLDHFKAVNDTLGHEAGDELLAIVATRIVQQLPRAATVARLGGDEFVALLPEAADMRVDDIATALVAQVGRPVMLRGTQFATGASLGIAVFPDDGHSAADLLRHADMAMYAAKTRGRGQVVRFEAALGSAVEQHASLSRDLARAVERDELRLHYQPRVDARTGRLRSVEALVRWQHPVQGLLMPGAFVALAEETGLITQVGRWVLQEACRQMAAWRSAGLPLTSVAVNLSVQQLREPALVDEVFAALHTHGLAAGDVELEVTESVMVGDVQATTQLLARLRAGGVRIAIDDFGTGYSSMAYLRYLPVDVLKIDRAFVQDIGSDASADTVVRAIVGLARSLNLATVAEGVETAAQARLLADMGCDELQGFHFARPLPAPALAELLRADRGEALALAS